MYAGANPYYLSVICELARREADSGRLLRFIDLSPIVGPVEPHGCIQSVIESAGGVYVLAARSETPGPRHASDTDTSRGLGPCLTQAVRSGLITEFRDELPENDPRWIQRHKTSFEQALRAAAAVREQLQDPVIGLVYIANGRFPYRAAAAFVAKQHGTRIKYFEQGEQGSKTFFLAPYQTLDYSRTQAALQATIAEGISPEVERDAREWFDDRVKGIGHIFGRAWSASTACTEVPGPRKAVIFTTSEDEYAELDDEWKPDDWIDQWSAIEHVSLRLVDAGYGVTIRVHPNLASKSHRAYRRALRRQETVRRLSPDVRLIRHDETTDSYALARDSDIVVVWNSTIGLEAVVMGKPVRCLTAAFYDQIADVRAWYGPEYDQFALEIDQPVDTQSAIRFRAAVLKRDQHLSEASAADQALLVSTMRWARVRRFFGVQQVFVSLPLWWDLIRHRRISATTRILVKHARHR